MMKRYFMTFVAIACSTMAIQAQSSWADCFTVSNIQIVTADAYGQDYTLTHIPSVDPLLTGGETCSFTVTTDESTYSLRKELEIPEDTLAKISMIDMYGAIHAKGDGNLKRVFQRAKFVNKTASKITIAFLMARGGEYDCTIDINIFNFKETKHLQINGAAGFDFLDNKTINCGKDTVLSVTCNTGYPYDYSSLKGDEYARATVYRINDDDTETELHSHEINLPFKQANQPLIAQVDTLYIGFEKPEVGKYRVLLESNWEGLKERSAIITVVDPSATGINVFKADSTNGRNDDENTYTLNGMKVGKGTKQPKGIYIRKGRKYINR